MKFPSDLTWKFYRYLITLNLVLFHQKIPSYENPEFGIIQTLRNTVFGEHLSLPLPLVTVRNFSNMHPPSVT